MPRLARLRSYLPLALAIFVALLCSVPGALAVDPSVIVFQGFRNAENPSSGVYTMSPNGNNVNKITVGKQPSISRDGKKIVFVRGGEIYLTNADGDSLEQVTNDDLDHDEPVLSPDGKTIVFSGLRRGKSFPQIFAVNSDGTNERALTPGTAADSEPSFSPDGNRIVFVRGPGDSKLVTMPAGGGDVKYLTGNFPFSTPDSPSYSPNGKRILFHAIGHNGKEPGNFIYSFDADDGSNLDVITKGGNEGSEPAYSPDGSSIVYRRNINLYSMDADGGNVKPLTNLSGNDGGNIGPSWGR